MREQTNAEVSRHAQRLRSQGARLLCGVISDSGGVLRSKAVPAERIEAFATAGMGASPSWSVFCVDNGIAMTESIGVVGDLRVTADLEQAVVLDNGFAWAPADVHTQDGARSGLCWRDVARRQEQRLTEHGISVRAGYELEFTVLDDSGRRLGDDHGWPAYGLGPFSHVSELCTTVVERLATAGVPVDQVHAEYGTGQLEVSLPPMAPVQAADAEVLARTIISRVARELDLMVSFSPMPFPGGAGNGAHVHVSFDRDGVSLLDGGAEPTVLPMTGRHLLAGIVEGLSESIAVLAGSVVSAERLVPNTWAGAFSCWGLENREAAVRLVAATPGTPYGANAEIKCIDGAANPYLALGLVLGLAADGLENERRLPSAVEVNPAELSDAAAAASEVRRLPTTLEAAVDLFDNSARAGSILGPELHSAVLSLRRYELEAFSDPEVDRHAATRFAWSA